MTADPVWITYPIAPSTKLRAYGITGGTLAVSALADEDGNAINSGNPLPVGGTVAVSNLPADPPTGTAQDAGNAALESIDGKVTACNTGAVTVATCALPNGAATETTLGAAKDTLASILAALPSLVSGRTPVQIGADGVGLAKESGGILATISSTLTSSLSKLTSIDSDSLQQVTLLTTLAGIVTGGRALVTEASAATIASTLSTISTALTGGTQISQVGASASSAGAWSVARFGANGTSLGTGTVMVKSSAAGRVRAVYVSNKSGGAIWCGVTDRATALSNAASPDYDVALANGAGNRVFDGGEAGAYFANGICLSFSKTQQATDNTTVVSGITVIVFYA